MIKITPLEPTEEMKTAREICGAINKLLTIPAGEQIYRRELNLLFDMLALTSKPLYRTENTWI